jgi:hypothetical protein
MLAGGMRRRRSRRRVLVASLLARVEGALLPSPDVPEIERSRGEGQ